MVLTSQLKGHFQQPFPYKFPRKGVFVTSRRWRTTCHATEGLEYKLVNSTLTALNCQTPLANNGNVLTEKWGNIAQRKRIIHVARVSVKGRNLILPKFTGTQFVFFFRKIDYVDADMMGIQLFFTRVKLILLRKRSKQGEISYCQHSKVCFCLCTQ